MVQSDIKNRDNCQYHIKTNTTTGLSQQTLAEGFKHFLVLHARNILSPGDLVGA